MNECAYSELCKANQQELEKCKIALAEAREIILYYAKHPSGAKIDMANKKLKWVQKYGKDV